MYFSGELGNFKHVNVVGFLGYKVFVNTIMRCHPISSGLLPSALGQTHSTSPLLKHNYALKLDYDDEAATRLEKR
ncbi:hypothetical protein RRG08_055166 [Elysia crispata]|uniref:Uncharacterized protein n=1 Tax=Elysia crispata TaxID=231223 RepID=A0AAE1CZI4_9GAST|nr:hypothetical protein RRG08_055166 [Elysia crispata]